MRTPYIDVWQYSNGPWGLICHACDSRKTIQTRTFSEMLAVVRAHKASCSLIGIRKP